jgi:Mucin-2 protein WxxW repeating region
MRRSDKSVSSRLLALPLALALGACGGGSSPDETLPDPEQPPAAPSKRDDTGATPPVHPAPSTRAAEALELVGRTGNSQTQRALSYRASNTNSATVNTVNFYFNFAAGQTITLGTCGLNGASGSGDTYLRFYGPSGVQVAASDDDCGSLSNFSYTVPATGTYRLGAGCFDSDSCSGTVAISVNGTLFSDSASNTNSATVNTRDEYVNLPAGYTISLGTCGVPWASGRGDTYLRLYNPSGVQVAYNDDSCGQLSNLSYSIPADGTYLIRAGCWSSGNCSSTVAYTLASANGTWTAWLDRDDVSGQGDYETLSDVPDSSICNGARPVGIQCRTVSGGIDWLAAGEVYHCTIDLGGYCSNSEQPDGSCQDYEARFLCP